MIQLKSTGHMDEDVLDLIDQAYLEGGSTAELIRPGTANFAQFFA